MCISIPKCTAKDWTYSALQYWQRYFFRSVAVFELVYFSVFLGFKYAYMRL